MGGQTNELGIYLQAVKSRFWLVMLMVAVAVSAAYSTIGRRQARYTAQAMMMVTAPVLTPPPSVSGRTVTSGSSQTTVTADILELINSRPIAARVAKRLDLPNLAVVQRSVSAFPQRGTSLIWIAANDRDPELAALLANTTAEEFIAYFREANRNAVTETRRFAEEQLALSRSRLEQSERAIQGFRESRRVVSAGEASARVLGQMNMAETELDVANRTRSEVDARLVAIRERLSHERPVIVASRATTGNPIFQRIQSYLVELEIRRTQLAQLYTPQHPRMQALSNEIADVRNRMLAEAKTMVGEEITTTNPLHARLIGDILSLEVERAAMTARIAGVQNSLQRRQQDVQGLFSTETEFNRLMRENRILEANYTTLATRYQDLLLRENEAGYSPASIQLMEAAVAPLAANASSFPKTAAAAGVIGMVLGILGALLLEAFDDRIRSAQDAERVVGAPVLAQIPTFGAAQPRVTPAPAVFVLMLLLVAGAAWVAIARTHPPVVSRVSEEVRKVTVMMAERVPARASEMKPVGENR
jgi:succinoglycan biosynthesis transport protein ExoP